MTSIYSRKMDSGFCLSCVLRHTNYCPATGFDACPMRDHRPLGEGCHE